MATLNVKVPGLMDEDIEAFLEEHPHYLNKSELVRDALRHLLGTPPLAPDVVRQVREGRAEVRRGGDPVELDDLDDADDLDGGSD